MSVYLENNEETKELKPKVERRLSTLMDRVLNPRLGMKRRKEKAYRLSRK